MRPFFSWKITHFRYNIHEVRAGQDWDFCSFKLLWWLNVQNRKTSCTFLSIILPDLYGGFSCVSNFGGFWVLSITLKIRKFRSKNKWNALIRVEILRSKWSTTPEVVTGRSVRQPKLTVPFPKILVSNPASLISKQNFGRNANGSLRFN